jgi:hypothetical protein
VIKTSNQWLGLKCTNPNAETQQIVKWANQHDFSQSQQLHTCGHPMTLWSGWNSKEFKRMIKRMTAEIRRTQWMPDRITKEYKWRAEWNKGIACRIWKKNSVKI